MSSRFAVAGYFPHIPLEQVEKSSSYSPATSGTLHSSRLSRVYSSKPQT